ncbi:hypothetical protein DICSQDRAFT_166313 [Dichomitus squalens LYAD-421 SS1]|uniref:uncharacterized protein n=1 Tax=Dichomitus squalens (strain LYAD-421) TaxID=732165 RepID=UPI0004415B5B|nr:uncharacterized protein DICSQDRAFT_166313 [Dichomitus squalens LYAD-421 SS1]EJF65266.1 hypothetical protein DICSQDRAFT_166313 [Dichomitus squalens LYAD-421 SS1]
MKQNSPSPRSSSSSVERFLLTLHSRDDTHAIAQLSESPFIANDHREVARPHVDIDALDFKWERFDRGDIVADASSASSPRHVHPGSEEAFWSQPAGHIPTPVASPTRLRVPRTDSSPASLRLTGISTPVAASPHKQAVLKHLGDREKDGGLFAWIVPPRDAPPPSTPKASETCSHPPATGRPRRHNADQDFPPAPASRPELGAATARCSPGRKHQRGVADRYDPESTETRSSPPGRLPFAPGSGIYISPLRDNPGDGDEAGGEDSGSDEAIRSEGHTGMQNNEPATAAQSANEGTKEDAKRCASQLISDVSTQSDENRRNIDDDIEEDESSLQGCSQESKDSIESWTN